MKNKKEREYNMYMSFLFILNFATKYVIYC